MRRGIVGGLVALVGGKSAGVHLAAVAVEGADAVIRGEAVLALEDLHRGGEKDWREGAREGGMELIGDLVGAEWGEGRVQAAISLVTDTVKGRISARGRIKGPNDAPDDSVKGRIKGRNDMPDGRIDELYEHRTVPGRIERGGGVGGEGAAERRHWCDAIGDAGTYNLLRASLRGYEPVRTGFLPWRSRDGKGDVDDGMDKGEEGYGASFFTSLGRQEEEGQEGGEGGGGGQGGGEGGGLKEGGLEEELRRALRRVEDIRWREEKEYAIKLEKLSNSDLGKGRVEARKGKAEADLKAVREKIAAKKKEGGEGGGSTRDRQREGFLIRKVASLEKRLTTINKLLKGDGGTAKEGEKEEAQRILDSLLIRCVN